MNDTDAVPILIVEDEPMVLDSLRLLLNRFGYRPIPCANASQAIEEFSRQKVDAVLTDVRMPGMSGLELLEKLREMDPEVPVILITAHAELDIAIEAVKKGAFDFIVKPYNPQQISHSVEKAVRFYKLLRMEKDYRDKLEELNRDMETLVAERTMSMMALTVADKIRNPAVALGMACRRLLAEDVSENLRVTFNYICQEADKLDRIVRDFVELLKSRKSMFSYEDINSIVRDVELVLDREAELKKVKIVPRLSPEPLRVNAQKNLLKAAMLHLLRNSLDATSEGGLITVETGRTEDTISITITDTGRGIPKENLERIFDPFFSTKERRFGMGLPLTKQIIEEHMGVIGVESEVGKGTAFRITLPIRWTEKKGDLSQDTSVQ